MKTHTQDFLCALLFVADPDFPEDEARCFRGALFHEFSAPFVAAVESFIDGFVIYLESIGFEMDRLTQLDRSFGGNVFFSLSRHGCGFWDEYPSGDRQLGLYLQRHLERYSGISHRFENLPVMLERDDNGEINLTCLPLYRQAEIARIFSTRESPPSSSQDAA